MNLKKTAAIVVVAAGFPIMVDVAIDPYADRGIARSWLRGAAILAGAIIMQWASDEVFHVKPKDPPSLPDEGSKGFTTRHTIGCPGE